MRGDINDAIQFLAKEEIALINKAELARRYDCDVRTVNRYLKIQSGELVPQPSTREYKSKLEEFKPIIINKVDVYGCTAISASRTI